AVYRVWPSVFEASIRNIPERPLCRTKIRGTMRACPARVALVVEDEWIVRNNIVNELRESGWTVVETATGEEALVLLADREVDVVLTDIQLAGPMTGWDVAHAARTAKPDLPIIYASANVPDPLRRVEGSLFFGKPYD